MICITDDPVTSDHTTMGAIDWLAVKRELLALRAERFPKQAQFARAAGLKRNTVVRIEGGTENPAPVDWDTLQRWLDATSQESIGVFLTRVENKPVENPRLTSPVIGVRATVPSAPPPPQPGEASSGHGPAADQARLVLESVSDIALLERLVSTFVRAIEAIGTDDPLRSGDEGAASSRDTDPLLGGTHPPNVRRVK